MLLSLNHSHVCLPAYNTHEPQQLSHRAAVFHEFFLGGSAWLRTLVCLFQPIGFLASVSWQLIQTGAHSECAGAGGGGGCVNPAPLIHTHNTGGDDHETLHATINNQSTTNNNDIIVLIFRHKHQTHTDTINPQYVWGGRQKHTDCLMSTDWLLLVITDYYWSFMIITVCYWLLEWLLLIIIGY